MHVVKRRARGFTLIETLVVVAIVGLAASAAAPELKSTVNKQAGETAITDLARLLATARAEAVTSGRIVTVCSTSDGERCGGAWQAGMVAFIDTNADRVINGDDRLLRKVEAGAFTGSLTLKSFPGRPYLQFTPVGFTNNQTGNFTWCPDNRQARYAQQLIFTQSGRLRLAMDRDGDGIRENSRGQPLNCAS